MACRLRFDFTGVKTSVAGSELLVPWSSIEVPPSGPKETRRDERFLEEEREEIGGRTTVGVVSGRGDQLHEPRER